MDLDPLCLLIVDLIMTERTRKRSLVRSCYVLSVRIRVTERLSNSVHYGSPSKPIKDVRAKIFHSIEFFKIFIAVR